jgi:hypothetical protein
MFIFVSGKKYAIPSFEFEKNEPSTFCAIHGAASVNMIAVMSFFIIPVVCLASAQKF